MSQDIESVAEEAALRILRGLGYAVLFGPAIAPMTLARSGRIFREA